MYASGIGFRYLKAISRADLHTTETCKQIESAVQDSEEQNAYSISDIICLEVYEIIFHQIIIFKVIKDTICYLINNVFCNFIKDAAFLNCNGPKGCE